MKKKKSAMLLSGVFGCIALICADQLTKYLAVTRLAFVQRHVPMTSERFAMIFAAMCGRFMV